MSDAPKPVEETPSSPPAATEPTTAEPTTTSEPTTTDAAAPEATPAAEPTEAPAATESTPVAPKEESVGKGETKIEATPASEGVLGYKAPGLLNQFRFSQKYFWFGDEAVGTEHLSGYLRNEKSDSIHHNAAWSSQTGKGLLYFAKRQEDKPAAAGIINLADISEVAKESFNEFSFKLHGHKHTFQTGTSAERASWLVAIEKESAEAKSTKEGIVGSEGYKQQLEKFTKPAAVAAPAAAAPKTESTPPKKSLETKVKDTVKKDKTEPAATPETKSRSQSRKRSSIFGTLRAKKEEHEEKKEVKKEEKAEEKADKEAAKEDKADPTPATDGEVAAAAAAPAAVAAAEEKKEEEPETKAAEPAPATNGTSGLKSKRGSIFGSLFPKKETPKTEKSETEAAPAVPAKDKETPPVSAEAPQLADPVDEANTKPISTGEVTAPLDAPAKEESPKETTTAPAETSSSPSKGGFLGFLHKQEAKLSGHKDAKKEEKAETKAETKTEEPAPEKVEEPAATTPATSTPAATETTNAPVRDKRRTSLFGSLGTKKEKKADTSDTEGKSDGETKHSPLPGKLGGLFRKPSKAAKSGEKKDVATGGTDATPVPEATESTDKPEPISKDAEPLTNGTSGEGQSIGDVVPEAVTTGHQSTPEVTASA